MIFIVALNRDLNRLI